MTKLLTSIFIFLLLSGSHTAAVEPIDERRNIAQATAGAGKLAAPKITSRKPPLDARLAHWASIALAGLVSVSCVIDLYKILFNTKRFEDLQAHDPDAQRYLKMPHTIKTETRVYSLMPNFFYNNALEKKCVLGLEFPQNSEGVAIQENVQNFKQGIINYIASVYPNLGVICDNVSEYLNDLPKYHPNILKMYFYSQGGNVTQFILQHTVPLDHSTQKTFNYYIYYKIRLLMITTIDRLPYIIQGGAARALTGITSVAFMNWMHKNPPTATRNGSNKRAAGFLTASLCISLAWGGHLWFKGESVYVNPFVPFLTAASLFFRGYAEWRCKATSGMN